MNKEIKQAHAKLVAQIEYHNDLYYNQDSPEISDYDYDLLSCELKQLESDYPELISDESPTQKVGGKRVLGIPVEHKVPMLSLQDVFDTKDVEAFVNEMLSKDPLCQFTVEQKIDGLSLSVEYQDGEFIRASTRGDGQVGEDVTENVRASKMVPLKLVDKRNCGYDKGYIELRGECYMTYAAFENLNAEQEKQGKKLFANPRNCAAGKLRQSDINECTKAGLSVFIFNVQQCENGLSKMCHASQLNALEEMGFEIVDYRTCNNAADVINEIEDIGYWKKNLFYGIDGAVVKVNDLQLRETLGNRGKTPKWAIAFKYPPEVKETEVLDIVWQVGRTGKLTPVAIVKPVSLAGTSVGRVTLCNFDRIQELDVRIGDIVSIRKAGEIIPELIAVNTSKRAATLVSVKRPCCPECGEEVHPRGNADGTETVDLYCENFSCPAKLTQNLIFFGSRDCMDIDGLGPSTVSALVDKDFVSQMSDLYLKLPSLRNELVESGCIGKEKSVDNLLAAIEKSKTRNADRVLKAFGWPNIGGTASKVLLSHFDSITELFSFQRSDIFLDLQTLDGFGKTLVQSTVDMINDADMQTMVRQLSECGVNMEYAQATKVDVLKGKSFVVTGTLPTLGRKEIESLIELNGGKVSGSVSKNTAYVVAGEAAGSKLTKANDLGVPVLTEEDFLKLINK